MNNVNSRKTLSSATHLSTEDHHPSDQHPQDIHCQILKPGPKPKAKSTGKDDKRRQVSEARPLPMGAKDSQRTSAQEPPYTVRLSHQTECVSFSEL